MNQPQVTDIEQRLAEAHHISRAERAMLRLGLALGFVTVEEVEERLLTCRNAGAGVG